MVEALVAETVAMYKPYEKLMPSMDPKHFARPPIKFLAMTVGALAKKTGFAKGLFTDEQLKGALPERDDKLAFFDDLRKYTEIVAGTPVDVNSRSIAAGKEVEKTLMLLQLMVKGAESPKVAFDVAIEQVRGGGEQGKGNDGRKVEDAVEAPKKARRVGESRPNEEQRVDEVPTAEPLKRPPRKAGTGEAKPAEEQKVDETPAPEPVKKVARKSAPVAPKAPGDEVKAEEAPAPEPVKKPRRSVPAEAPADDAAEGRKGAKKPAGDDGKGAEVPAEVARKARKGGVPEPDDAGKRPRKKEEDEGKVGDAGKRRGKEAEQEAPDIEIPAGPKKVVRRSEPPPADNAEAQGARKAPPRARKPKASVPIEEPVVPAVESQIQDDNVFVEEDAHAIAAASSTDGQLVSNILAAYRKLAPETATSSTDPLKEGIEVAKGLLQHLARQAQPLDTLLQFAQEDLGNMENDFKRWTQEVERQSKRLDEEMAAAEVSRGELRGKLDDLDRDIERQEARLRSLKASALAKEAELFRRFAGYCSDGTRQ